MKKLIVVCGWLALFGILFSPLTSHASTAVNDTAHFCGVSHEESRRDRRRPAAKRLANLNVGEPRTVRMIYFVPDDRPSIENIDTKLDSLIKEIQRFYADEMERNGFGRKSFVFESDASGKAVAHHVNGQSSASYYNTEGEEDVFGKVLSEIDEQFDTTQNIYFIAADITYPGSAWRGGGQAILGGATIAYIPFDDHGDEPFFILSRYIAGHELGHSFGLQHDVRVRTDLSEADVMSYTVGIDFENRRLSKCAAEWLNVHPYFNAAEAIPNDRATTIRLLSPRAVPPNAVSLRFDVTDADGLHQAQLMIPRESGFSLHGCKSLNGQESGRIDFITTELTARVNNDVSLGIVDVKGNFRWQSYSVWVDDAIERVDGVIDIGDLAPETLRKVSGDNQVSYVNARLTDPFVVTVRDAHDEPVAGIQVTFQVIAGDGSLSVTRPWTDSDGQARSFLTLGRSQSGHRVAANVSGVADQVTFSAEVDATVAVGKPSKTLTGHTARVRSVAYSPDGGTVASGAAFSGGGGGHGTVRLWDAVTGEHKSTITGFSHDVSAVAYSSDGSTLATNGNWGEIRLWDAVSGQHKQTLEGITAQRPQTALGHTVGVSAVAYSPDGSTLATGDLIGEIRLWDAVTGQHKATLTGHPDQNVVSLSFSADSRMLASGGTDRIIRLWDAVTGQQLKIFTEHVHEIYGDGVRVAFSPEGHTLASTGAWDRTVRLWDAVTGQQLRVLTGHKTGVYPVAFSPDGVMVATGSYDSEIRLWEVNTGDLLKILIGHTESVTSVAFSPGGNTLASGSGDHTIRLWDVSPKTTPQSPDSDFDGDGTVGFSDFVRFAGAFGLSQGDMGYDAQYDLDGNGVVGFSDFVIFSREFGTQEVG